jgi:hypothetical protein
VNSSRHSSVASFEAVYYTVNLFQNPVGFSPALAVFQARALQNRVFLRLRFQN